MTFLAILDKSPQSVAEATADIFLNHSITLCAQLISSACFQYCPEKIVKVIGSSGVRQFVLDDRIPLLPPLRSAKVAEWVKWTPKWNHSHWLITLAWFLNKERQTRFNIEEQHPYQKLISSWQRFDLPHLFPKASRQEKQWDFPIVLPTGTMIVSDDPIQAYRNMYREMKKKGVKLKWSNRQPPLWLDLPLYPVPSPAILKAACPDCGAIGADPRICPIETCSGKKAYNL